MIGVKGDIVETWGVVDAEYIRRFTQAVMDPDPRFWDPEFAAKSRFGQIVTPPIMASYAGSRLPPGSEDPIIRAFRENPNSDGIGGVRSPGALPKLPTPLVRILNAGNDCEVLKYPSLGDKIYFQSSYHKIVEHVGKDGNAFLVVTLETRFWNQRGETLCYTRGSTIRR
jgi:hypothetical protein